jgi:hypothetical protein
MKIIIRWLLLAAALLLVANLYPGVQVSSFTSAMVAGARPRPAQRAAAGRSWSC